jgi:hypothetical protein
MAGGTIDLNEIATSEILYPSRDEGSAMLWLGCWLSGQPVVKVRMRPNVARGTG